MQHLLIRSVKGDKSNPDVYVIKKWDNSKGPSFNIKEEDSIIKLEMTDENGSKKTKKIDMFLSKKDKNNKKLRLDLEKAETQQEKNKIYRNYLETYKKDFNKDFIDKAKQCKQNLKTVKPIRETSSKPQLFEFPLKYPERLGYLKPILQRFIQYDSESICYENPPNNSALKKDVTCLLRLGIKNNPQQSFLQTIARILKKSLIELKQVMISELTINKYVTSLNGGLIDLFYNSETTQSENIKINDRDVNEEEYKNRRKIQKSYNNFKKYLENDKIFIDYTCYGIL